MNKLKKQIYFVQGNPSWFGYYKCLIDLLSDFYDVKTFNHLGMRYEDKNTVQKNLVKSSNFF